MSSLDNYNKIRGEFKSLIGEVNLTEDDECCFDLITNSRNPKKVLQLAKEMKEQGNSLFRKGEFDNALERYGYVGLILSSYDFREEEDRIECCDMILCIWLNSTACLSRNKEYEKVGRLCSIILEFQPSNVKALYRRAMAAVAIGKTEWAFWDLMMAAEIDPNNQEVCKKLDEVKSKLRKMKTNNHSQNDGPLGLGSGFSLPLKNRGKQLQKNYSIEHEPEHENVQEDNSSTDEKSNEEILGMKEENDSVSQRCAEVKQEITFSESMEVEKGGMQDEMKDGTTNDSNPEKSIMAEPKYRFVNRRRPGSFLSISKKDYQLLLTGRSIKYVHSKLGCPVTIKVLNNATDGMQKKEVACEKQTLDCAFYEQAGQKIVERVGMETPNDQVKDIEMEISSSESKKRDGEGEITSAAITCSEPNELSEWRAKKRKSIAQLDVNLNSGVKRAIPHIFPSNHVVTCRSRIGSKRKIDAPQSALVQHPRKKSLFVSSCSVSSVCQCNNNLCANDAGTKIESSEPVEVAHDSVMEARME